jgi:hypothetical protein
MPGARTTSIAEINMRANPSRNPTPSRPMHPAAKALALVAVVALSLSLVDGLQGAISGHVDSAYSADTPTGAANPSTPVEGTAGGTASPGSSDGRADAPISPPF